MSEIQHPSLKADLLYLIGRSSAPLSCADLYERSDLAEEIAKVAKALANLQHDGKIVRVAGEGRARYALADGVQAPAPAGKKGRSKAVQADDAAHASGAGIRPADDAQEPGAPAIDIPRLGDALGMNGMAGKAVRAPKDDAVANALDQVEAALGRGKVQPETAKPGADAARLADAIIARLKRDFGAVLGTPLRADLDVTTAPGVITINVERVEINVSVGVAA